MTLNWGLLGEKKHEVFIMKHHATYTKTIYASKGSFLSKGPALILGH